MCVTNRMYTLVVDFEFWYFFGISENGATNAPGVGRRVVSSDPELTHAFVTEIYVLVAPMHTLVGHLYML